MKVGHRRPGVDIEPAAETLHRPGVSRRPAVAPVGRLLEGSCPRKVKSRRRIVATDCLPAAIWRLPAGQNLFLVARRRLRHRTAVPRQSGAVHRRRRLDEGRDQPAAPGR